MSIGAVKLYQLAVELQKALEEKKHEQIKNLETRFYEKFKIVLAEIRDYLEGWLND